MPNIEQFTPQDLEKIADSFARMMPVGGSWDAPYIAGKNYRNLLKGIGGEMNRFQQLVQTIATTYIPNLTNSVIDEWETFLGIPDECFVITIDTTNAERRRNILIKLAFLNLQTEQDYINLGIQLGLIITLEPQGGSVLKVVFSTGAIDGFPYTFPFEFEIVTNAGIYECLVNKQKPAHVQVIYEIV